MNQSARRVILFFAMFGIAGLALGLVLLLAGSDTTDGFLLLAAGVGGGVTAVLGHRHNRAPDRAPRG
jgi:hypothetical protein